MLENLLNALLRPVKTISALSTDFLGTLAKPLQWSPLFKMTVLTVSLLLLCWMLFGCSTPRKVMKPPLPAQASERSIPSFTGRTNRDAIMYGLDMREGWGFCEADKAVWRRMHETSK